MFQNKYLLLTTAFLLHVSLVLAGDYNCHVGNTYMCPLPLQDEDKVFCCNNGLISYCCDFGEYANNHPGIIAGIVIGVLILVSIPVCCCLCCFCACCPIYQRRVQRGAVIYRS